MIRAPRIDTNTATAWWGWLASMAPPANTELARREQAERDLDDLRALRRRRAGSP